MKKFLSLVLALVMTMSLVTVSAGAKDFTDSTKIQYPEAVDVMSAVKVIDGYTDGSFNPTATLTRGAAAKIICNLILGPTTASALVADAAPYKDVPTNHTFAGYIAYCQKEGIISGYADGTFKPANSLTGYAFMKMLLGALGYDAKVEGYTGPNWSINVAKRALNIGLDDGLTGTFNGVKAVNREEACLYAFNTLQATMVEYDAKTSVSAGDTTVVIAGSKAKDMTNTAKTEAIKEDNKMQFAEKYFEDLKLEKGRDDFGRPANTWKVKKDEVGTYANRGDLVNTYTKKVSMANVYADLGKTVVDDLKDGDSKLVVYTDGVKADIAANTIESAWAEKNNTSKVNSTGNGDLTEIYVDDDNNVTIVTIRTYVYEVVGDYNSKKEQVTLGKVDTEVGDSGYNLKDTTLELEDYAQIKDYKDGDYVLVTGIVKDGKLDLKSVEKAEVISGEVKGYKVNDNVQLGDKTYDYSTTFDPAAADTRFTVGQQASVVLDKYGYVIAIDKAMVLTDYVFINEIGSYSTLKTKAMAEAIFTDGSKKEIELAKVLGDKSANSIISNKTTYEKKWFTFSKNADGEYTLYTVESKYIPAGSGMTTLNATKTKSYTYSNAVGADNSVSYNNKVVFLKGETYKANDDTIFLVSDKDDDVTVYTGVKNAPEIFLKDAITGTAAGSASVYLLAKTSNGYASVVYIDVKGNTTISGEKETNLVYVLKYDGEHRTTDNEVYFTYTTLADGEKTTVKADNKIANGKIYQVANYVTKKNDQLTNFTKVTSASNSDTLKADLGVTNAITYSAGTLSIGGTSYVVTNNTKINLITLGKVTTHTTCDATVLNKDKGADYEVAWGISAKTLADTVNGYTYTYDYALKTTSSDKEVLDELFVTVTNASTTTTPGGSTTTEAGTATVNYTVASNGTLRYKLNYTAPSYVAGNANVKFKLDVYASGKYYDTIDANYSTTGLNLTDGEFTKNGTELGYPNDEELTFEMVDVMFSAVNVEYKGTGAKVTSVASETYTTATVGTSQTLKFKLDTTATSGTVKYTVTQGKNVLQAETSLTLTGSNAAITVSGLNITDDAAVVVTITGMDALTEMYKVTVPTVAGFTFTTIPAAATTAGVAKGTEVYVYVNADPAVDASVYGKEIAVAGYNTVLLTNADSTTTKKEVAKITVSKDVTLTATATEIAKLAQDGVATASTDGKTITVKFNRDIADGATFATDDGDAVITGVTVSGKTATITLNNALAASKKITITSVVDAVYAANKLTTGDAYTA